MNLPARRGNAADSGSASLINSAEARADAFRVGLSFALAVCGSLARGLEPDRVLGLDLPLRPIDACVELCRGSGHEAADHV